MRKKDDLIVHVENLSIGKKEAEGHSIFLEYDVAKAMVPIYALHRSHGMGEKEAREKAFKEMQGILKFITEKHIKNENPQDQPKTD